jgi:Flp pilus assembly protein CpaB
MSSLTRQSLRRAGLLFDAFSGDLIIPTSPVALHVSSTTFLPAQEIGHLLSKEHLVADVLTAPELEGRTLGRTQRRIERHEALPGPRAVVGALLVTVAAVGIFLAYTDATTGADERYAVADGALDAGTVLDASHVRFVPMQLADEVASGAFVDIAQLEGRRLLAPLLDGDLLQASGVSDRSAPGDSAYQVSFSVPRAFAVNGLIRRGDLVDVYVTHGDSVTELVVRRATVLQAPSDDGRTFSSRGDQVIVLQLRAPDDVVEVVHATRSGAITLVRSTFADPDDAAPSRYPTVAESTPTRAGSGG